MSDEFVEADEVEEVLAALRCLLVRVANPVVRACLAEASEDIVHLMSSDGYLAEDQSAAA